MDKKRLNDYLKSLEINESIEKMYKRLAELDYLGLKHNDEYNTLVDLIRDTSNKNDEIIKKYPLHDDDIVNFINLITDINKYDNLPIVIFLNDDASIKVKRFIEHHFIYELENKDLTEDDVIPEYKNMMIDLNGVIYPIDKIITLFNQSGYKVLADKLKADKKNLFSRNYRQILSYKERTMIRINLQNFTLLDYFDIEINKTTDKRIKKRLIKSKYILFAMFKSLEDSFLFDQDNYSKTIYYQKLFKRQFNKEDNLYKDYNDYYIEQINDLILHTIGRNKDNYNNLDDKYKDIILSIYMRTLISLLNNEKDIKAIYDGEDYIYKLNNNKLNRDFLNTTKKLNENLILSKKL